MKILADGGLVTHAPENTYEAIQLAVGASYVDGVLIDVRLSRDNEVVLMRDNSVDRTTNCRGAVKEMDLDNLLRVKMGNKVRRYQVPSLRHILERYQSTKPLVIRLADEKEKNIILVEKVLALTAFYQEMDIAYASCNLDIIKLLEEKKDPKALGLVLSNKEDLNVLPVGFYCMKPNVLDAKECQNVLQEKKGIVILDIDCCKDYLQMVDQLGMPLCDQVAVVSTHPKKIYDMENKKDA